MPTNHRLKTLPEYFQALLSGDKTFEVRRNDRNFKVGDRLQLQEYDADTGEYTGMEITRLVTYVLANEYAPPGHVIMGLKPMDRPSYNIPTAVQFGDLFDTMWQSLDSKVPLVESRHSAASGAVLKFVRDLIQQANDIAMREAVAGEAQVAWWDGQDDGVRGACMRWQQALDDEETAGTMHEPLQSLRERTQELKARAKDGDILRWMQDVSEPDHPDHGRAQELMNDALPNGYPKSLKELRDVYEKIIAQLAKEKADGTGS